MACVGRAATADQYREFWCIDLPLDAGESVRETAIIETMLDASSADIYAAMAASGMCDCTPAAWAANFLVKLACIEAAVIHNCPCGRALTDQAQREMWLNWVTGQLELIRMGKIELCQGATGSEFPALGWAEQTVTIANTVKIISNRINRLGS